MPVRVGLVLVASFALSACGGALLPTEGDAGIDVKDTPETGDEVVPAAGYCLFKACGGLDACDVGKTCPIGDGCNSCTCTTLSDGTMATTCTQNGCSCPSP